MSEHESRPFDPDAHITLHMGEDREVQMHRRNTRLFTFVGRTALQSGLLFNNENANHVFIQTQPEDDDDIAIGTYIFHTAEVYPHLVQFIAENSFPMDLNRDTVPQCDLDAYGRMVEQTTTLEAENIPDTFPDDWQ